MKMRHLPRQPWPPLYTSAPQQPGEEDADKRLHKGKWAKEKVEWETGSGGGYSITGRLDGEMVP